MLDLPRAVRLTLWGRALLAGRLPAEQVARAVTRDDEPHAVDGSSAARDLPGLLEELRAGGVRSVRAVLPAPGDPAGLAGPAEVTAAAVEAGEAVLALGGPVPVVLVPEVTAFGSTIEPGATVRWQVSQASPPRPPAAGLREVERELLMALRHAAERLGSLDVARWRDDAALRIADVRDGALAPDAAPAGTDPRLLAVLTSAARVRAVVALALEDDGAAVSGWEADQRSSALREADAIARRCLGDALAATEPAAQRPERSAAQPPRTAW